MPSTWRTAFARAFKFNDLRAWALILGCLAVAWLIDPSLAQTIAQWAVGFGVFVGLAVMLSRHVLPQISLRDAVVKAIEHPIGAGQIVLGVLFFLGMIVLSLTLWSK